MAFNIPKLDVKYFVSPQVLPLPVGLLMIIGGLAGGFRSNWFSFELETQNGVILAIIGTILTFYSLWIARRYMSVEADYVKGLLNIEKRDQQIIHLLRLRTSLSPNMDKVLGCIESVYPGKIKRSDLEESTGMVGRELSLRLNNLILQGFINSEIYGDSFIYSLTEDYSSMLNPTEQAVEAEIKEAANESV